MIPYSLLSSVVVTAGKHPEWRHNVASLPTSVVLTGHNFNALECASIPNVKRVIEYFGPFNWAGLANLASRDVSSEFIWFTHDDVVAPSEEDLRTLITTAIATNAAIVVPTIVGDTRCSSQKPRGATGWSDLTELCTDACALIRRFDFESTDGFFSLTPGGSFDIPGLQLSLFEKKRRIVVSHDVQVQHSGSTISGLMSVEERRKQVAESARWISKRLGFRLDYDTRIALPRLVQQHNDVVTVHTTHDRLQIGQLEVSLSGDESEQELLSLIANHSDYNRFDFNNVSYTRYARGDRFVVLRGDNHFHIGVHYSLGFGDTFFIMKVCSCIKRSYPGCTIELYTDLDRADLFERCSDVDIVHRASSKQLPAEAVDVHRFSAFGTENCPENISRYFGARYDKDPAHFKLRAKDVKVGDSVLQSAGRDYTKPLMVIQAHGGWIAKRWCNTAQLVRQALHRGWQPWLVGIDDLPRTRMCLDGVMRTGKLPILSFVAALSHAKVLVGFDSGVTHACAALGVPSVSIWGPHDPLGVLLDAQAYNTIAIRKRVPFRDCGPNNCRTASGGSKCPLRDGAPGGDCLDEVKLTEIWNYVDEVTS